MNYNNLVKCAVALCIAGISTTSMTSCTSGSSDGNVVVSTPIVYTKRHINAIGDPLDPVQGNLSPGGDLFFRDLSSPSSRAVNVTSVYTKGQGDASDPEVSYNATRVVFSMRGPEDPTWNIWEWFFDANDAPSGSDCLDTVNGGCLLRVMKNDAVANDGNDIDPVYVSSPEIDPRIIFSSDRQRNTFKTLGYHYLDEYERRTASVLHIMEPGSADNDVNDATNDNFIDQTSVNQSHDIDPFMSSTGDVIYTRWGHLGGRNLFPLFKASPDGKDMFVFYGTHSQGAARLHAREMPAGGAYDGKVIASLMPISGTQEGGALIFMDVKNFSEDNDPAPGVTGIGVSFPAPFQNVPFSGQEADILGAPTNSRVRVSNPYPLYDGTDRVLIAWSPITFTQSLDDLGAVVNTEQPPRYGIQVFDPTKGIIRPVVPPPSDVNFVYMEPVSVVPRKAPPKKVPGGVVDDQLVQDLKTAGLAQISVLSVYDNDRRQRMGAAMANLPPPKADGSPDLAAIKNLSPDELPARFVRVTAAVPTPAGIGRDIGDTNFEMQQIVGYTMVAPDGSMTFNVAADTAATISVLDSEGRAFQTHVNWIQARPGEIRTCPGCHSPRRPDTILNNVDVFAQIPAYVDETYIVIKPNQSMADARVDIDNNGKNIDPALAFGGLDKEWTGTGSLRLDPFIGYFDVWRDTDPMYPKNNQRIIDYSLLDSAVEAGDPYNPVKTKEPVNGIINYTQSIQPIWDSIIRNNKDGTFDNRKACNAAGCHSGPTPAGLLDLTKDKDILTGRYISYADLRRPRLVFDDTGAIVLVPDPDPNSTQLVPDTEPPLVIQGNGGVGGARGSRLLEILFGEDLDDGRSAALANDIALNVAAGEYPHKDLLNESEKRVLTEWADIGAQYYNEAAVGNVINGLNVASLDEGVFEATVNPILVNTCGTSACHVAGSPNAGNFVLTSNLVNTRGNLQITANFIDANSASSSLLLNKPISGGSHSPTPGWTASTADYITILNWITAAGIPPGP